MCRAPRPRPQSELMISIAFMRFAKFASGSPIPMNTMLLIFSPAMRSTSMNCPAISAAERFRDHPSRPLAQNLQPYAQPTWVLMQIVRRSLASPYKAGDAGISTLSINAPSGSRNRNFCVVSFEPSTRTFSRRTNGNSAMKRARNAAGKSLIFSYDSARFPYSQRITWPPRYFGSPSSTSRCSSSGSVRF